MKSVINPLLNKLLRDTARLTRSGKLVDATLKIQRALTGAGARAATQNGKVLEGLLRKPPAMRKAARPSRPAKVDADQTGRFDVGHFNATTGTRDYKLFVPSGHADEPLPLVVMLHGCKQDPDDFAAGTRMNVVAQELGLIVLYPQQPPRSNMAKCWNWFQPGDQQRGRGEPELLAEMTRHIIATEAVDADRVFVAGLSAGGAMAAILGREYPDLFAAVGVHSGLPAGAASDVGSAFAAMHAGAPTIVHGADDAALEAPMIVFHGDQDTTVHPSNGEQLVGGVRRRTRASEQRAKRGHPFTHTTFRGDDGAVRAEYWVVHGAGHAWSGGSSSGSYADEGGPDASREMARFFLDHPRHAAA
jgi:poly(hydroxyalkanoate) depolymerase family esterase